MTLSEDETCLSNEMRQWRFMFPNKVKLTGQIFTAAMHLTCRPLLAKGSSHQLVFVQPGFDNLVIQHFELDLFAVFGMVETPLLWLPRIDSHFLAATPCRYQHFRHYSPHLYRKP